MAITVRQQLSTSSTGSAANLTLTLGAGTLTSDVLVLVQADDFYTLANEVTPTGTAATTWTLSFSIDGGTNHDHVKVWTAPVASAGAKTVIAGWTTKDAENFAQVFVLTGAAGGLDGSAGTALGASSTSGVAPTVTPTSGQADDLLICYWGAADGGSASATQAPPGGMTACTQQTMGTFFGARCAYEQLASASATGTRTATLSPARAYTSASVLVKSATAAATASPIPPRRFEAVHRSHYW